MSRGNRRHPHDDAILPPPERGTHDPVERLERIVDDEGRPASPYVVIGLLERMLRSGSITDGMKRAGDEFRMHFARSQLDPLKCADLSKPIVDGGRRQTEQGRGIENARDVVWRAIVAVGGLASPGGSCIWHVIGWERSLREWSRQQGWNGRLIQVHTASGILIATLGALESHFWNRKK